MLLINDINQHFHAMLLKYRLKALRYSQSVIKTTNSIFLWSGYLYLFNFTALVMHTTAGGMQTPYNVVDCDCAWGTCPFIHNSQCPKVYYRRLASSSWPHIVISCTREAA